MSKIEQLCAQALQQEATTPAIEFEQRWFNWGELRLLAQQLDAALDASGAGPRAAIAFVPRNRPSAVAALLALLARGRWVRMLYAFQSPAALARDVERLKPAVVIAGLEDFSEELLAVMAEQGIGAIALEEMDATAVTGFEHVRDKHAQDSAPQQIEILTSGTTGPPKHFAISYETLTRHFVSTSHTLADADGLQRPPNLLYFPLGNISGIYSTLPPLLNGQRVVLLERFCVAGWQDHLLRFRPAFASLPPAGVQMVLDAGIPREDLSSVKALSTGAAPLDPGVHRAFEQRYGVPILLSYGATEFGGPVTAMTADLHAVWGDRKLGSVGRALPGAQLRVVDAESGAVLPSGQEGLLEVISPRIGPEWIRTSDIALIDEDDFVFHRGRADGAIMRGGFKLLPETIERALLLHAAVSAVAVTGIEDRRLGQVPAASIQIKTGLIVPTVAELEAHLRQHIYATHIPVHWRFVDSLPRTPSMKVDRVALRQSFEIEEG